MAIELNKTLPNGFSGKYWKLIETNVNWLQHSSRCTLVLYKDEATRQAEPINAIIDSISFDWNGTNFPFSDDEPVRDLAYAKIKESKLDSNGNETNPFHTSEDV